MTTQEFTLRQFQEFSLEFMETGTETDSVMAPQKAFPACGSELHIGRGCSRGSKAQMGFC
jgi:hypothetical protein